MENVRLAWKGVLFAVVIFMIGLVMSPSAMAGDITIWDKMGTDPGPVKSGENNEVEPGNVQAQSWDLEAFYLKGSKLYVIGGFNFKNGGYDSSRHITYMSGDLFLDTAGIPLYGPNNTGGLGGGGSTYPHVQNGYGYNYVLDFARDTPGGLAETGTTGTYDIVQLTNTSWLEKVYFSQNGGSNPFQYVSGGTKSGSGTFTDYGSMTASNIHTLLGDTSLDLSANGTYTGDSHYVLAVDLGFLPAGTNFYAHFTEGCGNDDLIGHGTTPVPEPGTMVLLGSGLVGLAGWGRKKFRK